MPLAERTRIEIHVPGALNGTVQKLVESFVESFAQTFGRCTVIHVRDNHYSTRRGLILNDPTTVIFSDATLSLVKDRAHCIQYMNQLRQAAEEKLEEQSVLVAAQSIYHSVE